MKAKLHRQITFTQIILAIIYLLYGVIKLVIGALVIILTPEQISKIPVLKIISKEAADKTLAGCMYTYILMAFGVFTIVHAFILFGFFSDSFVYLFEQKIVQYGILLFLGVFMTVFYIFVLYTNIPITKNPEYNNNYFIIGLLGGISFLVMPPLWELIEYTMPFFRNLELEQQNLLIIASVAAIAILFQIIYVIYIKSPNDSIPKEVIQHKIDETKIVTANIPYL